MKIEELNISQNKAMKKDISKEEYIWEDQYLTSYLEGKLPLEREVYRYTGRELSEDEKKQNKIVSEINEIINKYNNTMQITENEINELKQKYVEYEKYKEMYFTSYSEVMNRIIFNKTILISGPGGIGKSQFLYEFSEKLKNKFDNLCIYGKYCDSIDDSILEEIKKISEDKRFYFIIDAINEFAVDLRNRIYDFIKKNKSNKNLRIIISLRDYSMDNIEVSTLKSIVDTEEIFAGIDPEYALEKISEKYNLDLSVYDRLLYDNNPLHLKFIINSISNNQLTEKDLKPITRGTYVLEHFIKKVLTSEDWETTKIIVSEMLKNKEKRISETNLRNLNIKDINTYIDKMKSKNFIGTYSNEEDNYIYYINETLTDYLIARTIMYSLNGDEKEIIIQKLNDILNVFYSINDKIILMLFEKFEENIDIAIEIMRKSGLIEYLDVELLNEINIHKSEVPKIQKLLNKEFSIKKMFVEAGGNENNPFNCVNFLNKKLCDLLKRKELELSDYENRKVKSKLKIYVQTVSKFDYNEEYIDEKFWFAIWCSSCVSKINRALAKKLVFEIVNVRPEYIKKMIRIYYSNKDEFIREMIVQVLSSLKKNNKLIIDFFNKINNSRFCNIKNIFFINRYIYGEENYDDIRKIDFLKKRNKRVDNTILSFLRRIFIIRKYDYEFFGFEPYGDKIEFQTEFLIEKKSKIVEINKYIKDNYQCVYSNECSESYFRENFIDNRFDINKDVIDDKMIYLAWQRLFKIYLKKYNIKIKELDKLHVYEEEEKGMAFKALELSLSNFEGSITCNHFTSDFELYRTYKGFQYNWYDSYDEKKDIYYPIAVFNEDVENLNNKIIKKIILPEKKNIGWVKDWKSNLNNILKIIEPIKYKNEYYYLIYGSINIDEKEDNGSRSLWRDTYIINMAIDEDYNLTRISNEDRLYTIETNRYRGNINDYELENFKMTTSLYSASEISDLYVTTDFNLPPTTLVKELQLHYNKFSSSWNDNNENEVILINNYEGSWYQKGCVGSIYIKKEYLEKITKKHDYKYFCFTEKYHPRTGYCIDSALQVQINSDGSILKYKHYKSHKEKQEIKSETCKKCIVTKKEIEDRKKWKNDPLINFIFDEK